MLPSKHHSGQIDADQADPVIKLDLFDIAVTNFGSGIGKGNVEAAIVGPDHLHQGFPALRLFDPVRLEGGARLRANRSGGCGVGTGKYHFGPFCSETPDRPRADPRRAAGDQSNFPFELTSHLVCSLCRQSRHPDAKCRVGRVAPILPGRPNFE